MVTAADRAGSEEVPADLAEASEGSAAGCPAVAAAVGVGKFFIKRSGS